MRPLAPVILITSIIWLLPMGAPAAEYHALIESKQQGPLTIEQIGEMAASGNITAETLVWTPGMATWEKASDQEEIQPLFTGNPPLAPAPPSPPVLPPVPPAPNTSHAAVADEDDHQVTEEEKQDTSIYNFPLATEIAGNNLEKQRDQYLENRNMKLGFTKDGSYIGWGIATIDVSPQSIDFGQKRIMAFERAFTDAKGQFVQTQRQKVGISVMRKFANTDMSDQEMQVKDGKIVGISKKLLAVAEAKLDNMLEDLGVDPKTIENSDIAKKRQLAEDSLSKEIAVQAVQSVVGIRILATFEDVNAVGVLIKQNQKYRDLAKAIASRKLVAYPSKTSPVDNISAQLNRLFVENTMYIPQYGVRIMTYEYGNRAIVSFGQWSPKVTKSDSKMKTNMAVKAAKDIAYDQALSYMTQFINTTLALENKSRLRDSNTITEIFRTDQSVEEKEQDDVGAAMDGFIRETSQKTLEGVTEVTNWTVNHPETGHLILGKVLMWSPVTQQYARQKTDTSQREKRNLATIKTKVRSSVDIGDEDF
jgi:hypothetical protein